MKYIAFLCGIILICALSSEAQMNSGVSLFQGSSASAFPLAEPEGGSPVANAFALGAEPEPEPQGVYGVLGTYNWQAYVGYTHYVFYEIPGVTVNLNGFNMSLVYYPHGGHFAGDGEFMATFASPSGVHTRMVTGMGGVRGRILVGRGAEVWIHGLAGVARFLPQTAYGSENAFAFDAGGGVDLNPRHKRLGLRLQADMVGSRFFGTYQYSPKFSAGIVYKF